MRTAFGHAFDIPDGYLDTASLGIPPTVVGEAVADCVSRWARGALRAVDTDDHVRMARQGFADLVGVEAERVAMGATVSSLVGLIAASAPDGSRVLVATGDFASVSWPFAAQESRGVTVTEVELSDIGRSASEFDVVAVSVVQSADGRIVDLDALRRAQAAGVFVLLDATQSLGWLDAELGWADAVVGSSYKWLLSPRGVAWMFLKDGVRPVPHLAGWYAGEDPWTSVYGMPIRLSTEARALDTSPAWFPLVAAARTLPWLASLDREAVREHCVGLADAFRGALGLDPAGSAIVQVRSPGAIERLAAAGIRATGRFGAARLAFHLYNTVDDVDRAAAALKG